MANESLIPVQSTVAIPDRRWWGFTGQWNKSVSLLYTIAIWNLEKNEVHEADVDINPARPYGSGGIDNPSRVASYQFTTPPKSYEIVEAAATTIVPTQEGGKFIESHGNIFKEITIAGTVGLRPNPHSTELIPGLAAATGVSLTVPPLFQSKDDRGLHPSEKTGFDEIIHLRNIFRHYYDLKSNPDMARKIVMIWMYLKESEIYVVEPISFTTSRDSSNPLGWNYSIALRTIHRFDETLPYIQDPLNFLQSLGAVFDLLNKLTDTIIGAVNQLAAAIDFVANLPANLVNRIMSAASIVVKAVIRLANSILSFPKTVSQSFLKTVAHNCPEIREYIDTVSATREASNNYFINWI